MSENYNDENVKTILESEQIPERLEPENIKKLLDAANAPERKKKIKHSRMLRVVSMAAAVALVAGTSAYFLRPVFFGRDSLIANNSIVNNSGLMMQDSAPLTVASMKPAVEYKDIYSYFFKASSSNKFKDFVSGIFNGGYKYSSNSMSYAETADDLMDSAEADEENYSAPVQNYDTANESVSDVAGGSDKEREHSDTYNQEEGVLEADIVKTDGERIFYVKENNIYMAKVNKGKFERSDMTDVYKLLGLSDDKYSCNIMDMYIYNNRLIILNSVYEYKKYDYKNYDEYCYDCAYPSRSNDTYVMMLSIGDSLTLDGYYIQDGNYNDVRLMENGYMYLVTNDNKYLDFQNTKSDDIEEYIPRYCVNGDYECVPAEDVLIPKKELSEFYNYISYMNFSGLDLNSSTPWQPADMKTVAGYSNTIYCSQKNLYVVSGYDETEITRFSLEKGNIAPVVSGKVDGYINDQFSMSEYGGYFRIATTKNIWEERFVEEAYDEESSSVASNTMVSRNNYVYVLDMDLKVVGSISDFGLNEEIKSVNFNGNTAYVVTFRNTDPLYAIDLSDPASPKLLDELKISGFSTYMQKWSDGLLVGFGSEADENTGGVEGVKLTMFDNSDPDNLKAVDTVSIVGNNYDEYVTSIGISERKALYIDPKRNIIGFPVQHIYVREDYVQQFSYEFYSFENGKLVFKGRLEREYDQYDLDYGFNRAVYIDGYIYAVSADVFKSADIVTFKETDSLKFDNKNNSRYNNTMYVID